MSHTFTRTLDGVEVAVDVGPLVAWESSLPLGQVACGATAILALGLAVWAATDSRSRPFAAAAPVLAIAGAAIGLWTHGALTAYPCSSGPLGNLFPELQARFHAVGLFSTIALTAAAGAGLGALIDVPSWTGRRYAFQGIRVLLASMVAGLALLGVHGGAEARSHGTMLAGICGIPRASMAGHVPMHVNQSVTIEDPRVTSLGRRHERALLFAREWLSDDPGSEEDLAKLEAGEHFRTPFDSTELTAWVRDPIVLAAPSEPGPFEVPIVWSHVASRGSVRATSSVQVLAISDAPDSLLPLQEGSERVWARSSRSTARRAQTRELGEVRLRVEGSRVVDGFLHYTVRVGEELFEAVPWDGVLRRSADPEAARLIERVEGDPDEAGVPCRFTALSAATCSCGPLGPTRCVEERTDTFGHVLAVGLGIITVGVTAVNGVRAREDWQIELRLTEADGAEAEVPSIFEE